MRKVKKIELPDLEEPDVILTDKMIRKLKQQEDRINKKLKKKLEQVYD